MTDPESAIRGGRAQTNKVDVTEWGVLGFFLPVIGIMIAYLRKPVTPASPMSEYDAPREQGIFEWAYAKRLKDRRINAAWFGGLEVPLIIPGGLLFIAIITARA